MGALGQALSGRASAAIPAPALHQLTVGSVKSCYGHTEGAAGLTGALLALQAMRSQVGCEAAHGRQLPALTCMQLMPGAHNGWCACSTEMPPTTRHTQGCTPILHLRSINPYVESTFADWRKAHHLAANAGRQAAPLPLPGAADSPPLAGTSSFGMSGVNACALLEAASAAEQPSDAEIPALHRQRHWALVPALYFAQNGAVGGSTRHSLCSFAASLARPELAYLWDHQVIRQHAVLLLTQLGLTGTRLACHYFVAVPLVCKPGLVML